MPRAFFSSAASAMSRLSWSGVTGLIIPVNTLLVEVMRSDVIGHRGRHQVGDGSPSRQAIPDLVRGNRRSFELNDLGVGGIETELMEGLRRQGGFRAIEDHEARLAEQRAGIVPAPNLERGVGSQDDRERPSGKAGRQLAKGID